MPFGAPYSRRTGTPSSHRWAVTLRHTSALSRNRLRFIIYGYGALLVLGIVVFPRQWWAVLIVWFVVAYGFLTWYMIRLRRARNHAGASLPAGQTSSAFLRREVPSLIVAGVSFLLLGVTVMTLAKGGSTTPHIVWGSLLLLVGSVTLIWATVLRFRRRSGDS